MTSGGFRLCGCGTENGSKTVVCLFPQTISEEDLAQRTDLRHLDVCSVDPPGCTDIDDALHCRHLPNGNLEVTVKSKLEVTLKSGLGVTVKSNNCVIKLRGNCQIRSRSNCEIKRRGNCQIKFSTVKSKYIGGCFKMNAGF